ncbi:MAG: permease [Kiritimatiellae bacterium]|nr:permease [Kiritimatiellia bacterium]
MISLLHLLQRWVVATWDVTAQMAPYLLFGFGVAGLLHVLLPTSWVARHLGGDGWRAVAKASLIGVPLPLCSCGVVPVALSLRRQGASRGAVAAFLMSTPQTGADSILVTWGLLGPVIAVVRPIAAFLSGLLVGFAVGCGPAGNGVAAEAAEAGGVAAVPRPRWQRALRHGFVTLPADIGRELLAGLAIAGLLGAIVPSNLFADRIPAGWPAMLLMLAVGIPIYVCSTASVPIALGLIRAGISPGAAMVFLITGPATNAATLTALGRILGGRSTAVYLGCLALTALLTGAVLDVWVLPAFPEAAPLCHTPEISAAQHGAAAVLLGLLTANWRRRK